VGKKGVERVERAQREVVFYLRQLAAGASLQPPIWIVPRFPMTAQMPPARVYEYYQPDYQATAPPTTLTVRAAAAGAIFDRAGQSLPGKWEPRRSPVVP
jgi:hypothetical protein